VFHVTGEPINGLLALTPVIGAAPAVLFKVYQMPPSSPLMKIADVLVVAPHSPVAVAPDTTDTLFEVVRPAA
jgi:hypothetical protein